MDWEKRNRTSSKKTKIHVSLAMSNKSISNIQIMQFRTGESSEEREEPCLNEFTFDGQKIKVELDKENKCLRSTGVRIQQPSFHSQHPLQNHSKYNGGYLSKMISQRVG